MNDAHQDQDLLTVIVVDRHYRGKVHAYHVHGYTHCGRCSHVVALGDGTVIEVQRGVRPLCLDCAMELYQSGDLLPASGSST